MNKLKRYTMSTFYNEYVSEESPDGEWVKYDDLLSEHMEFLSATGGLDSEEQDDEDACEGFECVNPKCEKHGLIQLKEQDDEAMKSSFAKWEYKPENDNLYRELNGGEYSLLERVFYDGYKAACKWMGDK